MSIRAGYKALAILALVGASAAAQATDVVTGNPVTDGWTNGGNSLAPGVYVQGAFGVNFDLYTRSYSVLAGSTFSTFAGWQVGDIVIGVGGVVNTLVNEPFGGLTKFGGAVSNFNAASPGPARGSFSSGHSGDGGVLVRAADTTYSRTAGGELNNPSVNGLPITPSLFQYLNGSSVVDYSTNAAVRGSARMITVFDTTGADRVSSWETLLNVTALQRALGPGEAVPAIGQGTIVAFSRETGGTTTEGLILTTPVPEPSAYAMALFGLGLIGLAVRRRNRA